MKILNNTHYHTIYSMFYNTFPDPDSFGVESSRRDSFYQRLFYEYVETKSKGGITFFYTLTYNDKSIPKLFGRNTFSYKDIRYVTNGRLSKTLARHYGAHMRYFCSCERGEGKGKRGIGNNPHYHFIFFVTPFSSDFSNFNSKIFDVLIKELWQGKAGYVRFQSAKFGCVKEGKFGNVVNSTEAFKYVSKYVTKDSSSKSNLEFYSSKFYDELVNQGISTTVFYYYFLYLQMIEPELSLSQLLDEFNIHSFNVWRRSHSSLSVDEALNKWILDFCRDYNSETSSYVPLKYIELYNWFHDKYLPAAHKELMRNYLSEYSDKPRFSKSLGSYGLQFIKDVEFDPHFVIPSSNNIYSVKPCLYYQRKLYYNPVKCPRTGNILYRLNDLGLRYRLNSVERRINSLESSTLANLDYAVRNDIFIPHFRSDYDNFYLDKFSPRYLPYFENELIAPIRYYFKDFIHELCSRSDFYRIVRLYAIYNTVYRYRSYNEDFIALSTDLAIDDIKRDYYFFLSHSYSELDFYQVSLCLCQRRDSIDFSHFYLFSPFISYFNFLDSLNDAVNNILSEQRKKLFRERAELNKLHTANTII